MKISDIPTNTLAASLTDDQLDQLQQALTDPQKGNALLTQCKLDQCRRGRAPKAPKRPVHDDDLFQRQAWRQMVWQRLREIYLEPAKSRGRGANRSTRNETNIALQTLEAVHGFTDGFIHSAKTAATNHDADFFRAVVSAMEKLEAPRKGESKIQTHVRLALTYYLRLEQALDRYPTRYEIMEAMEDAGHEFFSEDSDKNHVWKESGLDRLKQGKPREYKRVRAFRR